MKQNEIGERIGDLRINPITGDTIYTQRKLAEKLGISNASIGHYESGARSLPAKALKAYHDFFKVSYEYLLGESDSKVPENIEVEKILGLSDEAINVLKILRMYPLYTNTLNMINFLIEQEEVPELMYGQPFDENHEPFQQAKKEYDLWKAKKLVPVLSTIAEYVMINYDIDQNYFTFRGELQKVNKDNFSKYLSDARLSNKSVVENLLLMVIQDKLKELKKLWDQ